MGTPPAGQRLESSGGVDASRQLLPDIGVFSTQTPEDNPAQSLTSRQIDAKMNALCVGERDGVNAIGVGEPGFAHRPARLGLPPLHLGVMNLEQLLSLSPHQRLALLTSGGVWVFVSLSR